MKYYEIVEPYSETDSTPVFTVLSEQEIIDSYYVISALLFLTHERLGYVPTKEQVIDEFIVVHWAEELPLNERREVKNG